MSRWLAALQHNRLRARVGALLDRGLLHSSLCRAPYLEFQIRRESERVARLARSPGWSALRFRPAGELLAELERSRRGEVCHILASGWSALDGLASIDAGRDAVFGFNFSAVSGVAFDLYFVEIAAGAPGRVGDLSALQAELVTTLRAGQVRGLHAKNFYGGYLEPAYLAEHYGPGLAVAMDIQLPALPLEDDERLRAAAVRALLRRRDEALVQYGSTTFTCIALAAQAGYRRIVVHGLDFGGQHFFSAGAFDLPERFLDRLRHYYPPVGAGEGHPTGHYLQRLLPEFRDQLCACGVTLSAGSGRSPAAALLPVYEPACQAAR